MRTLGGGQLWTDVRWRDGWRVQRSALTGSHRLLDEDDHRITHGSLEVCEATLQERPAPRHAHLVVLLHGLGRRGASLRGLQAALEAKGLVVARLDYASTRFALEDHAQALLELLAELRAVERVSFVTHSLGGMVVRTALPKMSMGWTGPTPHRLVMIAPPSRGAQLAGRIPRLALQAVMGPAALQMAHAELPPEPTIPFMIVAGGRGPDGLNPLIEGDDDGIVAVEEARLEGAEEFFLVREIHTLLMDHPETHARAVEFLHRGREAGSSGG